MAKQFTVEFKKECIKLVTTHGRTITETAAAMGIGLSTLQRWVRQYKNEQQGITPKPSAITEEHRRIQQLEAENKRLRSDNELLKKASAFFAQEMSKNK